MKRWFAVVLLGLGLCRGALAQPVDGVTPAVAGPSIPETNGIVIINDDLEPAAPVGPLGVTPFDGGRPAHLWGSAEYLLWTMKNAPVPVPLVVGGPSVPTTPPVLGGPMSVVALGAQGQQINARSGGRFTLGYWSDDEEIGTSITYFFLGTASAGKGVRSTGQPGSASLGIPFINATTGAETSTGLAQPGSFAGAAALDVTNDLQGWEWNGFKRLGDGEALRFHMIGGVRYLNLVERLTFSTSSPAIAPPFDVFTTQDAFDCRNYFYGGQVGGQAEFRRNRLTLRAQAKVALGAMNEVVVTSGRLLTNDFNGLGAPQTFPAGYFAGPTNNGTQRSTRFAVIPEVNFNVGYRLTQRMTFLVGYSFLYVSNVARPGNQIDRVLNPSQFPSITGAPSTTLVGTARPAPQVNTTDFWAQGVNFGLQFNY